MRVTIIAAMGRNATIGTDAGLPWHLPRDLKRFRSLTLGKPVILGRKTLDHIGHPLPGRPNVVLTRRPDFAMAGVRVAHTVNEAMTVAREEAVHLGADEVMVIGGGEVYRAFLPLADRVYLTVVDGSFAGNATFPIAELRDLPLTLSSRSFHAVDAKNPHADEFFQFDLIEKAVCPVIPGLVGVA